MMPGFTATAALERSIPTYQAAESNCASDRAGEVRPALPRQGGGGGGSYSRCYATKDHRQDGYCQDEMALHQLTPQRGLTFRGPECAQHHTPDRPAAPGSRNPLSEKEVAKNPVRISIPQITESERHGCQRSLFTADAGYLAARRQIPPELACLLALRIGRDGVQKTGNKNVARSKQRHAKGHGIPLC